jgi:hypothetical protein
MLRTYGAQEGTEVMDIIFGGLAFVGFVAAHLFAVAALRDSRAERSSPRPFRRIA